MPIKNFKLINQKISLEKAFFEKKNFVQETVNVIAFDRIENFQVIGQLIKFNFVRTVTLDPTSLFDVEVIFGYEAKIDDESFIAITNEKRELKADDAIKFVNNTNIPQVAAMIIANLTSINGANPLITAPIFIKKN